MPFNCELCGKEIKVGEAMLTDEKMAVAHQACVQREAVRVPIAPLPPTPPPIAKATEAAVQAARAVAFKMQHNIPVPIAEAKVMYGEPCLLPSAPKLCVECQKPAISMCPCGALVHQDFGYAGLNCSGRHESTCEHARRSRDPVSKTSAGGGGGGIVIYDGNGKIEVSANGGVHKPRGACGRKKKSCR